MPHTAVYYGPHTPVYYGPHPCVLWSTPLSTMVHTPVYYATHPCVLCHTPLCTMVHTPVYYGPHPCVLWSTHLWTIVLSNKTVLFRTATLQKTDYIYANLANTCLWCVFVCVLLYVNLCVCVCVYVCVCVCVCAGNQVATTLCMVHINKVHVENHHSLSPLICCHISY